MAAPSNQSPTDKTMSGSPKDSKRVVAKTEESTKVDVPRSTTEAAESKPATSNAPLAPPPRPQASDAPDYFSGNHSSAFSLEPNVFDASFSNPSVETPGRTVLPPVANITSPTPLPGLTPGWSSSLRAGPLSPAMLTGPASQTDYFGEFARGGGFPTPNESSLRTGLTPGGGGSMFPAPSPNIFNLQSGVQTPSTADFQQSALRAAAQAQKFPPTSAPTTQPETSASMNQTNSFAPPVTQAQRPQNDPYAAHDVSNAANDLLSFSQQAGASRAGTQSFAVPPQPSQMNNPSHMPVQPVEQTNGRRNTKGSINSLSGSVDTADFSESGQSEQTKTTNNTRSRSKKSAATNGKQNAGTKRKADEPAKTNNRKKASNGTSAMGSMDDESEEETSPKPEDGKKMTDEEKRKNFLERNRVAALKCRQRKKQWLANLQSKVELYSSENDALSATVTQLREEIVNLKTVLLAHKECPVSVAQGISGVNMNNFLGAGEHGPQNPYGIAQMPPSSVALGMPMHTGNHMQNRFVYPSLPRPGHSEVRGSPSLPPAACLPPAS